MTTDPHTLRRALKRRGMKPKTVFETLKPLQKAQFTPQDANLRGQLMRARCKRYAERTLLIGSTPFAFNKDGICEVDAIGRPQTIADFNALVARSEVELLGPEVEAPAKPKSAPIPEPEPQKAEVAPEPKVEEAKPEKPVKVEEVKVQPKKPEVKAESGVDKSWVVSKKTTTPVKKPEKKPVRRAAKKITS